MKSVKRALLFLTLSGALASCGVAGVGRLELSEPGLTTTYQLLGEGGQPAGSVACSSLEGTPVATQLRLTFSAADRLDQLRVQLRPAAAPDDAIGDTVFKRDNGDFAGFGDNTRYKVVFNADAVGTASLTRSRKSRWQALKLTAKPKLQSVKVVRVKPADLQGTFRVSLTGVSDAGVPSVALETGAISLYSNCDLVGDTKKTL